MRSLRTKIALAGALIITLTMAVATVFGVAAMRQMGRENGSNTLLLLCETGQKSLDTKMESVERSVHTAATFAESDIDGLDPEHLQAHVARCNEAFTRMMSDASYALDYFYRIDPTVCAEVPGFWEVRDDEGEFVPHGVTDISKYDPTDTRYVPWYTMPRVEGKAVWVPPYYTENLGPRVIAYSHPIHYRGKFVGVIGVELSSTTLTSEVDRIAPYESGYAFINDSDGRILYHPRIDVYTMAEQPTVPDGLLSGSSVVNYAYDGVEKLGVWMPLKNGMRLNVTAPLDEVDAAWRHWTALIVVTFAGMLVVFVIIMLLLARRITQPLTELTEYAKRVEAGDYDCRFEYESDDELGVLARTFNSLVSHIGESMRDLSDRAFADALTSLRNRDAFSAHVDNLQSRLDEGNEEIHFAVCVFDANNLKQINDEFGHDKGDELLRATAKVICDTFDHSPVFRIGGDEFAAVLTGRDYESRDELVRRFDEACARSRASGVERWLQVNVARGLAVYDPDADEEANDVVRQADRLMYEHKWAMKGKAARS